MAATDILIGKNKRGVMLVRRVFMIINRFHCLPVGHLDNLMLLQFWVENKSVTIISVYASTLLAGITFKEAFYQDLHNFLWLIDLLKQNCQNGGL